MQATTRHKPRSEKTRRQRKPSGWPGIVFSALLRVGHGGDDTFVGRTATTMSSAAATDA
jgi:hypothetical protein